ncbi:DUF2207 domain-containing protein [Oceanobacillus alkalisoli]|uniref:DUF2207 domain-containing protein n=1 Tax=Oceanobacillus alkalisoli TaxID=2925113 RepID=UPI001F1215EB|nr:DUF2207 domain-containing protein [Oceanobacillus alkalisoli]MCF3944665.1 DUF2207 domain-containing protein [Oceanobacillus alkalisoli]
MKKSVTLFLFFLIGVLLFPLQALAVDFTINETTIDAYLLDDGNVEVTESHTYEFDGEFNGITRSLISKEGTSITDFTAREDGTSLEVELEDETYKVFRSGKDEMVTIELSYLIQDGVEVYEDMAQFYWPFFDTSNESDYENLTVTIHPPEVTSDVIAYGFDEAYKTEKIESDGTVVFKMGLVDSGKKGDIRVGYDHALFSAAPSHDGTIREEMIREEQELADKEAAFLARQETLRNLAPFVTAIFGLLLVLVLFYGWRKGQMTKLETEHQYHAVSIVPKEILSMPATIFYFRNQVADHGDMLTAAMMDLVRKGNIESRKDGTYYLVHENTDLQHEILLIDLLFKKIGESRTFSFDQLEAYTKKTANQETFYKALTEYQRLLKEEINTHQLLNKHKKLRWTIGLTSLLLIPFLILFGVHELYLWLIIDLIIMGGLLLIAIVFQTQTVKGRLIRRQWQQFKEDFNELQSNNWYTLPKDDKERALIFSSGLKDKELQQKNKYFIENSAAGQPDSTTNLLLLLTLSSAANTNFGSATTVAAQSVTSSSSTGTGVGGGGGGSGAF